MRFSWLKRITRRFSRPVSRAERRLRSRYSCSPQLESLEGREVPAVLAHPNYVLHVNSGNKPDGSQGPTGYTPAQIEQAYGFNQISYAANNNGGAGTTIAIVDAYSDPNVASDLAQFSKQFNLPAANLKIVNESGGASLPAGNTGWAGEISLDVEWAHAIAPAANILLVEANSSYENDLMAAVQYAAAQKGVVAVSMSWGGGEFSGETSYDKDFIAPSNNPGVVFMSSSGDSGAPPEYPSISPNVLSVGGTSLYLSGSNYSSESAWSGSGSGVSTYETIPSYQKAVESSQTKRTDPDVSYDADPNTGFPVYQTYGNSASAPWLQYGGTSDAAPQWAAMIAIADQGRAINGESALTNAQLMPMLYKAPSADFHDVTTGSNNQYSAGPGYDIVTGIGTPVANNLVSTLVGSTSSNGVTSFTITPNNVGETSGTAFNITVTANNASGVYAGYTGTIAITTTSGADSYPKTYTFTTNNAGVATIPITLNASGTDTVTVNDSSNPAATGSATFSVSSPFFGISGPTTAVAGTTGYYTITAYNAGGTTTDSGYTGTVQLTSSDGKVQFGTVTFSSGIAANVAVTFKTAGTQSITVTDSKLSSMTGSDTGIVVSPGATASLVFLQQPTSALIGSSISPAVTIEEVDAYGNVETGDMTSLITVGLGANPGNATLSGGGSVKVSKGVATFTNLSLSAAGSGYTLSATEGTLSATSSAFNVTATTTNEIDGFQNGLYSYYYLGYNYPTATTSASAAHGTAPAGAIDYGDGDWYILSNSTGMINPGDTLGAWVQFPNAANGRAYIGFGTTNNGLYSVALAPNTNQFIIMSNPGFMNFNNITAVSQKYSANTWYYVTVQWGSSSGNVVANLYSSNGTTLLKSISASIKDLTPGWFAFRSNTTAYFSTVTDTPQVNNFVVTGNNKTLVTRHTSTPARFNAAAISRREKPLEVSKSKGANAIAAELKYLASGATVTSEDEFLF
jgi:subtilase family serine protease